MTAGVHGAPPDLLDDIYPGVFDGLPLLEQLYLEGNPGAPFALNLPGVQVIQ